MSEISFTSNGSSNTKWFYNFTPIPVTKIVKIASHLSDEEFAVNHQDIRELVLEEETLDGEEMMKLIDASTSNVLLYENKENE